MGQAEPFPVPKSILWAEDESCLKKLFPTP